jgi:hypothetical protein
MAKANLQSIPNSSLLIPNFIVPNSERSVFVIEKALLKQRLANLPTAQNGYIEKQKKALSA